MKHRIGEVIKIHSKETFDELTKNDQIILDDDSFYGQFVLIIGIKDGEYFAVNMNGDVAYEIREEWIDEQFSLGMYLKEGQNVYSPIFGELIFSRIAHDLIYCTNPYTKGTVIFSLNGECTNVACTELMLFPSKENFDWTTTVRPRAEINGTFFFITSTMTIEEDKDIYNDFDSNRYNIGNYFLTREAAEEKLAQIKELLK